MASIQENRSTDFAEPDAVYFMRSDKFVKIGHSLDPRVRRSQLQTGNPHKIVVELQYPTSRPRVLEGQIHKDLSIYQVLNEWYALPNDADYWKIIQNAESKLRVSDERLLQKDILLQKANLEAQLQELEQAHILSLKREDAAKNNILPLDLATPARSCPHMIPMVSFDDTVPNQIKTYIDQIEILYNVFDSVSIDPDNLTLSLNEAMFHAFLAEPNVNERQARTLSKRALATVTQRMLRSRRESTS